MCACVSQLSQREINLSRKSLLPSHSKSSLQRGESSRHVHVATPSALETYIGAHRGVVSTLAVVGTGTTRKSK